MRHRIGLGAGLLSCFLAAAAPPTYFELDLPDFHQTAGGGQVTIELPAKPIENVVLQLLGSADANLTYGQVRVKINGKGVGNIFNSGANERGKFLRMDPATLRMRPDPIFDPRENTVEIYGQDKRGRNYYQNWILRMGASQNPYFTYASSISPNDETGIPPDLTLQEPTEPPVSHGGSRSVALRVKGSASAAGGLSALRINNAEVKEAERKSSFDFDQQVALAPGATAVTVEAVDKKGNTRKVSIPVIATASAAPRVRMSGDRYGVVIGISRFKSGPDAPPNLPSAAADAGDFAETLISHGGFKADNILKLLDEKSTVEQMRVGLRDFAAKAKPNDLLFIYIATQGLHDPAHPERVYLAGADTQSRQLGDTALEFTEVEQLLNRGIRCRNALLFFDVDHELDSNWTFPGKSLVNTYALNVLPASEGRGVLVAGAASQTSKTKDVDGGAHGLFTRALLEGMAGKADLDQNHVITASELCRYVSERVREESGGAQTPQYRLAETATPVFEIGR